MCLVIEVGTPFPKLNQSKVALRVCVVLLQYKSVQPSADNALANETSPFHDTLPARRYKRVHVTKNRGMTGPTST